MVSDPALRHHALPVRHVCIISECEDARSRKLGREEGLGPWLGRVGGGPGLLAVARQAVDKDDTGSVSRPEAIGVETNRQSVEVDALDDGNWGAVEQLDARGEDLPCRRRRRCERGLGWVLLDCGVSRWFLPFLPPEKSLHSSFYHYLVLDLQTRPLLVRSFVRGLW